MLLKIFGFSKFFPALRINDVEFIGTTFIHTFDWSD